MHLLESSMVATWNIHQVYGVVQVHAMQIKKKLWIMSTYSLPIRKL